MGRRGGCWGTKLGFHLPSLSRNHNFNFFFLPGSTPQRRPFDYPTKLIRTEPLDVLRQRFQASYVAPPYSPEPQPVKVVIYLANKALYIRTALQWLSELCVTSRMIVTTFSVVQVMEKWDLRKRVTLKSLVNCLCCVNIINSFPR